MKRSLRCLFILVVCAVSAWPVQAQFTATPEAWRQDLQYWVSEVTRRHPNFYNSTTREEFLQAVNDLDNQIPFKTNAEIHAAFLRLSARANDAHTLVYFTSTYFRRFPIWLQWFQDGLYVTNVSRLTQPSGRGGMRDYRPLIGAKLVQIGATPIAQAIEQLRPFISYENEYWLHGRLPYFAITPDILKEAGIVTDTTNITLTLQLTNGQLTTITPPVVAWNASIPWITTVLRKELPLYRQNTNVNYWYKILENSRTLWLQYNRCADIASNPMANFTADMFWSADAIKVQRIVIDLRNNTGGNSEIIRSVINALNQRPWLNQRGRVYVITGNTTFSSGLWAALYFRSLTNAILIGEPTGGKPNSYGEVLGGQLPNTRLGFQYSTKFQAIVPGNAIALFPDIAVAMTAAAYNNNDDPVLDFILAN